MILHGKRTINMAIVSTLGWGNTLRCTYSRLLLGSNKWHNYFQRKYFSNSKHSPYDEEDKPFYITTPIFYVNAAPHIGHLYSMVLGDTFKRWHAYHDRGRQALLCTGTDEHGLKVQQAAQKVCETPKDFVDISASKFQLLATRAGIDYDRFIRTTDGDHMWTAQKMWKMLYDNGYIYKGQHSGWYCISDETFYPQSQIEKIVCPTTHRDIYVSKETGKEVEWTSEENYFFALSKFHTQLLENMKSNENFIRPKNWFSFIKTEIERGLPDLSISRPTTRCNWGIPVPGDVSQTMYVWLEALINYVTFSGRLSDNPPDPNCWPADLHIIGKDIVRFHCIYWPAFLLGAGLNLPRTVAVHSHWTIEGTKMSKSTGNVVDPFNTMANYGRDCARLFLLHDGHLDHDTPFSNERMIERHNTLLVNKLANLLMRVCSTKFDIKKAILSSEVPEFLKTRHDVLVEKVNALIDEMDIDMNNLSTSKALGKVFDLATVGNSYVQDTQPWVHSELSSARLTIIKDAAEIVRVCCIALLPFIPDAAQKCLDRLDVTPAMRSFKFAKYGADDSYGFCSNRKGDVPIKKLFVELQTDP